MAGVFSTPTARYDGLNYLNAVFSESVGLCFKEDLFLIQL